jgi:uncharacterized protein YqgV (UPF0045/DUF77 family)
MPQGPSEVVAEFTIQPSTEGGTEAHVEAGVDAARATGLAIDVGPSGTGLAGSRAEVLDALTRVVDAAIEAGAHRISVELRVATEAR